MPSEPGLLEDAIFERGLLASAATDAGPADLTRAWARLAAVASGPDGGPPGDHRPPPAAGVRPAGDGAAPLPARLPLTAAMKWVLLGAFGGSAVTMGLNRHSTPRPPAIRAAAPLPAEAVSGPEVPSSERRAGADAPGPVLPGSRPSPRGPSRRTARSTVAPVAPVAAAATSATRATLAAQVSRIDMARTALSLRDYDGALRLIERYHLDFPDGALAADADVVAMEAAMAKGDTAETLERARIFQARYPNDPHTARVRALAATAGSRTPR